MKTFLDLNESRNYGRSHSEMTSNTDGAKSVVGGLFLIFGLFACCFVPLLLLGGGLIILSFLARRETWFALATLFALALALYAVYLRRRSVGDGHVECE